MSPCRSSGAGTGSSRYGAGVGARPSSRSAGGRWCPAWPGAGVAAWALPRPSATASARLAKTTVSHSQTVISQANDDGSAIASTVVKTAPTSTMNMTGLRHSVRGSSLRSASGSDRQQLLGVEQPAADPARAARRRRLGGGAASM